MTVDAEERLGSQPDSPGARDVRPHWLSAEKLIAISNHPRFVFFMLAVAAVVFVLWPAARQFPGDRFYANGSLIPLCAAFIVFDRWDELSRLPVRRSALALVPFIAFVAGAAVSASEPQSLAFAVTAVGSIMSVVWLIAGLQWLRELLGAILYLSIGLPIWRGAIDAFTAPLQQLSVKGAFSILEFLGFQPFQADQNTIHLDRFTLNLGTQTTDLKVFWALAAITIFLMVFSRLFLWANLVLAATACALGLVLNSLRIALVGIVGNNVGTSTGHEFQLYSGFLALIVCFWLLYRVSRTLGWHN